MTIDTRNWKLRTGTPFILHWLLLGALAWALIDSVHVEKVETEEPDTAVADSLIQKCH